MWANGYVGIPYRHNADDRGGADCWGLVRLVYREEMGIELESHGGVYPDDSEKSRQAAAQAALRERERWIKVTHPKPYDVLLLRVMGVPVHVGIVVDARSFLHVMKGTQSIIEPIYSAHWRKRIDGFFRRA